MYSQPVLHHWSLKYSNETMDSTEKDMYQHNFAYTKTSKILLNFNPWFYQEIHWPQINYLFPIMSRNEIDMNIKSQIDKMFIYLKIIFTVFENIFEISLHLWLYQCKGLHKCNHIIADSSIFFHPFFTKTIFSPSTHPILHLFISFYIFLLTFMYTLTYSAL